MPIKKKTVSKRKIVSKPRNAGTMTEAAFWAMIRSALRQKSRWWKPITECKYANRRIYKGANKRQKFEYHCTICKKWFMEKNIQIDHIIPAGELNSAKDLATFIERLFCENGFQCLCKPCHKKKTNAERIALKKNKIKK